MTLASLVTSADQASTYWTREEDQDPEAMEPPRQDGGEDEWDDGHVGFYEEPELDENGEPMCYFEADREYDEEEALYIWAYNDACNQIYFDSDRQEAANFPAYQNSPRHVGPEERPAVLSDRGQEG